MHYLRGKCFIIGGQAVGKTALSNALVETRKEFSLDYKMTTIPKISLRNIQLQDVNTNVVDVPSVFALVFDVTDRASFGACSLWAQKFKDLYKDIYVPGILIGNKTDLRTRRVVPQDEAVELAGAFALKYYELSVREARSVSEPFNILAREFYKLYQTTTHKFMEMS